MTMLTAMIGPGPLKTFCCDSESEILRDLMIATGQSRDDDLEILSRRSGRLVVRLGRWVVKVHALGMNPDDLRGRLGILEWPGMDGIFLRPCLQELIPLEDDRWAMLWPLARPVQAESEELPWKEAGQLLARLHRVPLPRKSDGMPRTKAAFRFNSVLGKLAELSPHDERVGIVLAAARTLGGEMPERNRTLVHGDWHLGQMVFDSGDWRLIDPDDLGIGDPLWDLARPAAFFAAGLIQADQWLEFLNAYRLAAGPALPAGTDIWTVLDRPARTSIVQCAAKALIRSSRGDKSLTESEEVLINVCKRIAS